MQVTTSELAVEVDDYQNVLFLEGEEWLFQIVPGKRVEIRNGGQEQKKTRKKFFSKLAMS